MLQPFLLPEFKEQKPARPVNVASVPQRSPFRYPGGKTWLVPIFRRWMASLPQKPEVLVESFAGGGIIGLTAAFEGLADRVVMVELDAQIAAVWKVILGGDAEWLAKRILTFDLTVDSARSELSKFPDSLRELAFQTILRNRTLRGDFLMTYDHAEEVRRLADRCGFDTRPVAMKNTHHAEMTELLIGRNLRWVDNGEAFSNSPG